jgi:hypothetical protein
MDYVIELSSFGVSLRFNPILQILTSIRFSRMDEVILQFPMGSSGQVVSFSTPKKIATVGDIYQTFGPTTPGQYENNFKNFVLEYPGLAFVFAVPNDKSVLYSHDASAVPRPNPQDPLPNLALPLVSLYCRPSDKESQISTREDAIRELDKRPYVEVIRGESIGFYYPASGTSSTLMFGAHVQEVIAALGLPDQRFTKPNTAFNSSRTLASAVSTVLPEPDYFFNYFDLGVDVLFDGKLHVAKKFVLWTNLPSQPDFVRYSKCHYRIETRGIPFSNRSSSSSNLPKSPSKPIHGDAAAELHEDLIPLHVDADGQPAMRDSKGIPKAKAHRDGEQDEEQEEAILSPNLRKSRPLAESDSLVPEQITPQMKWPAIEAIMGPPTGNPYWFPTREGAFGGMTYFAYPNIIFEVMKKDEYVSKIFLFPD